MTHFVRALIPLLRAPPSVPCYLPKTLPAEAIIILEIEFPVAGVQGPVQPIASTSAYEGDSRGFCNIQLYHIYAICLI